jgi:hypothetical protein
MISDDNYPDRPDEPEVRYVEWDEEFEQFGIFGEDSGLSNSRSVSYLI